MNAPNELIIEVNNTDQATIVAPQGEIDLGRSPGLRTRLGEIIAEKPGRIIIDLSGVTYMDSSGVATLVEALQQCRSINASLTLCAMQDRVRSIFEIARLDMVFTIADTIEHALEA